jgi:cytochrome c peroxidase
MYMQRLSSRFLFALLCVAAAGCSDSNTDDPITPVVPAAPAVINPNVAVAFTIGAAGTYDATQAGGVFSDPAGKGLTYTVTLPVANGLTASGGIITGTPTASGVARATITATDGLARSVSDQFAIVVLESGLPTPALPATPFQYADAEVPFPAHFNMAAGGPSVVSTDNTPASNPITNAGATLGRVLFYDTRLSANDGTSCASCHAQSIGFSDTEQKSAGFAGGTTGRHSTGLTNARFYRRGRFFWDERAPTLEAQVLTPIQDATEMGMTLDNLVLKLYVTPYYKALFNSAFGSPVITSDRIASALAQYTRSLVSGGSRFDKAFAAPGPPNFAAVMTAQEQEGEQLFRNTGCAACHTTVAQVSDDVHNTGLDATITDNGAGLGAFKVASLRNVAVRQRFMHDGRFTSLEQVIEFYNSGVQPNPNLDPRLRAPNGTPRRLGLTASQQAALVAFLKTLTDSAFLTAPRFSNPFVVAAAPVNTAASVTMQNFAYRPSALTVAPGTVVSFTNLDNTRHSALFGSPGIVTTGIFTSGTRTVAMPSAPGTYTYHCAIHGAAMSGTITVK